MLSDGLKKKISLLPKEPGVYFHKDKSGEIIYVGKAANLNNRVRQYFQKSRLSDVKTDALVAEIVDVDWIVVASEAEALFLEAEMIRRYMPKFNILLRDDKSLVYVRINKKAEAPSVTYTRQPLDDDAEYFGPFLSASPVKKSLQYLRKIFPYSTHTTLPSRGCLQTHLGLCPGPETSQYDRKQYLSNLNKLSLYLRGERLKVVNQLQKEMELAASKKNFEQAAKLRNQLNALQSLRVQIIFSDKENLDLSKDHALVALTNLLSLPKIPKRIEGYDISHMSGTDTVASMVVFDNGVSNKSAYRKFKMRIAGNNDFAHMNEVIKRRLSPKNIKKWGVPDIFLIDGGKGQLGAAISARDELGYAIPMIGLAKKQEEIVINKNLSNVQINNTFLKKINGFRTDESDYFVRLDIPNSSHIIMLLQRIRDESHRFAISYHSILKTSRVKSSLLDYIPSVGPSTKKKLLRKFGSVGAIKNANLDEISAIVGPKKATIIKSYIGDK